MSTFNYPEAMTAFWDRWIGNHSLMRCPRGHCPGGCGANAKDDLAAIHDARRGRSLTRDCAGRLKSLGVAPGDAKAPFSYFVFACPHCKKRDRARFHEDQEDGGDRTVTLRGECLYCYKPWSVKVAVEIRRDE